MYCKKKVWCDFVNKRLILRENVNMKQKINYRNAGECLHATYKDMEGNVVNLQSRYLGTKREAPRFQFIQNAQIIPPYKKGGFYIYHNSIQ